ncbi:hypothetical protein [Pusillimonas sp.]|uniref:hypothetical protein n=1 Tax=Pusillimonas sp. TaxID=3040095 RepID=UPI0037CC57E9
MIDAGCQLSILLRKTHLNFNIDQGLTCDLSTLKHLAGQVATGIVMVSGYMWMKQLVQRYARPTRT